MHKFFKNLIKTWRKTEAKALRLGGFCRFLPCRIVSKSVGFFVFLGEVLATNSVEAGDNTFFVKNMLELGPQHASVLIHVRFPD